MNLKINAMIYFRFYEERRIEINLPLRSDRCWWWHLQRVFFRRTFRKFPKELVKNNLSRAEEIWHRIFLSLLAYVRIGHAWRISLQGCSFRPVVHRIPSRSSSKRCDERVKIARNTLEGSAIFPLPLLPGEIGRKRIKFGFLGFWIWPGEHVIPSLRTVKIVTPCWLGARPNAHNPRQRRLNSKRKSQGSMLIWMIDEARTNRILCLAWYRSRYSRFQVRGTLLSKVKLRSVESM